MGDFAPYFDIDCSDEGTRSDTVPIILSIPLLLTVLDCMVVADVAAHILLLVNLFDLQHCHDGLALVGENEETGRQHIMMAATNVIIAKIVIMVDLLNSMMYGKRYNDDGWCGSVGGLCER